MPSPERPTRSDPPLLHVLIADDVQETRRSTRLMMSVIPNTRVVAIAHNGQQAVEMAKEYNPDIAIIDINMPEMNGIAAIEAITRYNPDIVCIVISAEKDPQTMERAINAGARGYLLKPFTSEQLIESIDNAQEIVISHQRRLKQTDRLRQQRDTYLEQIGEEYARARRTDSKAIAVYEALVSGPNCTPRWQMTLAMAYVVRRKWGKLKVLAGQLEQKSKRRQEAL